MANIELGIDTFGDVTLDADGNPLSHDAVLRNVVEEGVLADQVGLDVFGVGEHHRADFAVSAPDVVLAAIAGRTSHIHLASAVTVLSSDDPVRVFQRFSTLDAISGGRAEVILGRGSFVESFPLFGYDLADYEKLFDEKLELFAALLREEPVTWSGTTRAALEDQVVYPKTAHGLRTWVGVGGNPESVVRAAKYGFPLTLAVIGGNPMHFAPLIELYHRALAQFGQPVLPVGLHSHGFVADSDEEALDQLWPHYARVQERIGRERGWRPMSRAQFEATAGPNGALFAGSPDTVAHKIAQLVKSLGLARFDLKASAGTLPHELIMRTIELYGTKVAPIVRSELAQD